MKKEDVVAGMLAYIAHLREVGRYSTAKSYLDALRSFKCFCGMRLARFRISRICSRGCLQAWRASGRRRCLWIACAR